MSTGAHESDTPLSTDDETETGALDETESAEPAQRKLELDVQIRNVGPCKKRVAITIPRSELDRQFEASLGTMKKDARVPGFRPGHAPRSLIEKRFRKEVSEEVKRNLLVGALGQLDEEYQLKPITQPKLDIDAIVVPDEGPLKFEIEVEVRPDFPLPAYKALTIDRPVKTITEADVDTRLATFLETHGQLVPKLEGTAEVGDYVIADLTLYYQGQVINQLKEKQLRVQSELRFRDGVLPDLDKVLVGARPGDTREGSIRVGTGASDPLLRKQSVRVVFEIHDLKSVRLPEVNQAFLSSIGFDRRDQLRDALRDDLARRRELQQRQAMRTEIMDKLLAETQFDLPPNLIARQEKSTVERLVQTLKNEGRSPAEIRAREAEIRANARESTIRGLKEYFILEQISEAEGIKVEESDFLEEIEAIAERNGESVRRVRSRMEKDNMGDALASQILERKTLDRILEFVEFREVPLVEQELAVETIDQTATPAVPESEVPDDLDEEGEGEGAGAGAGEASEAPAAEGDSGSSAEAATASASEVGGSDG